MNMKTSELTGAALDWAVAKCEGATDFRFDTVATYWITLDGKDRALSKGWAQSFNPSTDWSQGGPIIERAGIEIRVHCTHNNAITSWGAEKDWPMGKTIGCCGPTPLIAAMRCHVASKLGDEVDVPDELISA
jgi:hypothetical protein